MNLIKAIQLYKSLDELDAELLQRNNPTDLLLRIMKRQRKERERKRMHNESTKKLYRVMFVNKNGLRCTSYIETDSTDWKDIVELVKKKPEIQNWFPIKTVIMVQGVDGKLYYNDNWENER